MNHWRQKSAERAAAWGYLRNTLRADVALVQESVPPEDLPRASTVFREIAGHRRWGSAVVGFAEDISVRELWSVKTRFSGRYFTLPNTFPGSVAYAEVGVAGFAPITMVSLYNVIDVYAQTTLLRNIADLIPLMDSVKGSRVIVAGDLNISDATSDPYYISRAGGLFGMLDAIGLRRATHVTDSRPPARIDCACGAKGACRHIATWKGAELDHVFVSESLVDQVNAVSVDADTGWANLSDHAPLILDLVLRTREPDENQRWDEHTFLDEVERRHGAGGRSAVQSLMDWARDTEVDLRPMGPFSFTRFPTSVGPNPELWLQLDYGDLLPLTYTISIRASGEIVVQFQYMRAAPFDSPEARRPLLESFNAIPGIALSEDRLAGRPSFPLAVLMDPEALAQVKRVLDRIVDEVRATFDPTIGSGMASYIAPADA
jgi:endonuclease/exonuclease/phosphatase family metal-dependent hydrolase